MLPVGLVQKITPFNGDDTNVTNSRLITLRDPLLIIGKHPSSLGVYGLTHGITKPADSTNNNNTSPEGSISDPDTTLNNTGIADMSLSSDVVTHDYAQPSYDATYAHSKPDTDLGKFLGRLVKIGEFTWTPTSSDATILEVYESWLNNVTVSSKIVGYKYFRAKPVLHFVVNGFSWYYGKLLLATDLDPGYDGTSLGTDPSTQKNVNAVTDKAGAYQAPHVSIDPSMSCTYTLELPFYSANEWYEVTAESEFRVPKISLRGFVFNSLASANDVPAGNVSIAIYVEMRYLELSVPSWPLMTGLQAQSGSHKASTKPKQTSDKGPSNTPPKETQKNGILSGPLSSILNVTKTVHDFGGEAIPVVGPFLGPFNAIGEKAADALRIFGFASPLNLDSEKAFRQDNTFNFGGNFRDNSVRLTNDVKNNLAIDSAAATVGENDDMQVSNIISRTGLVHQFQWTDQGVNFPNEFATINVNPMASYQLGTNREERMTPLAHITSLHEYWSGSMVYTIEVVCSQFHRGTIGVSYIPVRALGGASLNFDELPNQFQTVIMDITETKSIEFSVPYVDIDPVQQVVASNVQQLLINNGKLVIYEINPLKSSSASNNVGINVYVRAGADFSLYRPTMSQHADGRLTYVVKEDPEPYSPPAPPAQALAFSVQNPLAPIDEKGLESQGIHDTEHHEEEQSSPIPERTADITSFDRSLIYFGEQTLTLKTLMSKPAVTAYINTTPAASNYGEYMLPSMPFNVSSTSVRSMDNYMSLIMPAFLTLRGGLRYKVITLSNTSGGAPTNLEATDINASMKWITYKSGSANDIYDFGEIPSRGVLSLQNNSGQVLFRDWISPVEIEIPYINTHRFFNPRKRHTIDVPETLFTNSTNAYVSGRYNIDTFNSNFDEIFVCGADDSSFHGYFMAPVAQYPI